MVTPGHAFTADVQLTRHTFRQRIEVLVEHIQSALANPCTNRCIHRAAGSTGGDFPQ